MRLLCRVGVHKWIFSTPSFRGRPMVRQCSCCPKRQMWDYDKARSYGLIVWIDAT